MAVTYDTGAVSGYVSDDELTWAFTVGNNPNRYLILHIGTGFVKTFNTVTYAGVAMTQIIATTGGTDYNVTTYGLVAPTVGNNNFYVAVTGNTDFRIGAHSLYNVRQSASVGTGATATDTAASTSINVSSVSGGMVVDCARTQDSKAKTPSGAQTEVWDNTANWVFHAGSRLAAAAGTTTMGWSWTGANNYSQHGICVYPAGAGSQVWILMAKQMRDFMRELKLGRSNPQTLQERWREALLPI